ncbi:hypothetical protein M8J77_009089 [Diaphorina citri]|nr:hypothetical protein M8J77_009089 [Diaphorina citri]
MPPPPDVQISSDVQNVLLRHITNRIMVTFHQTQRYTAICEFAFAHQDERGCTKNTAIVTQGKSELKKISNSEGSLIGKICSQPDECDPADCTQPSLNNRIHGNRMFQYKGSFFRNRLSQTCTMDYQAETFFVETHAIVTKASGNVWVTVNDKIGASHKFLASEYYYTTTKDGYEMYVPKIQIKEEKGKARCLSRDRKAFCVITEAKEVPIGKIFMMTNSQEGMADGSEISLKRPLPT